VALKLKTAWRGNITHWVILPLAFMQRLAALAPKSASRRPIRASE
jgi:hypothetical protein